MNNELYENANRFLTEQPRLMSGRWEGDNYCKLETISKSNYDDMWTKIDTVLLNGKELFFAARVGDLHGLSIGVCFFIENNNKLEMVARLNVAGFNGRYDTNLTNELGNHPFVQVKGVLVNKDYSRFKLATKMYKWLTDSGYIVVSDNIQYTPAKLLWKQLASESDNLDIVIKVYDHRKKEFLSDENGPIEYSGDNIEDLDIWGQDKNLTLFYMIKTVK